MPLLDELQLQRLIGDEPPPSIAQLGERAAEQRAVDAPSTPLGKAEQRQFLTLAPERRDASTAIASIGSPSSARGRRQTRVVPSHADTRLQPVPYMVNARNAHGNSTSSASPSRSHVQALTHARSRQRRREMSEAEAEQPIGRRVKQRHGQQQQLQQQQEQRAAATATATTNTPLAAGGPAPDARGQIDVGPQRCVATAKATSRQCERLTQHGCHCTIHRAQLDGTCIRASSVPGAGKGLWAATRSFSPGATVARYTGDLVRTAARASNASVAASRYVLQLSATLSLDAARTNTADGRMVNDARGSGQRPNARFVVDLRSQTASLCATRTIRQGTEVLVSYGRQFWSSHALQLADCDG